MRNEMIYRVVRAMNMDPANPEDRNIAKAAIAAMRDPTSEMITFGAAAHRDDFRERAQSTLEQWQAMIDAALV